MRSISSTSPARVDSAPLVVGQVGQPAMPAGPVEDCGDSRAAPGADDQVAFEMSDLGAPGGYGGSGCDRVELAERRFRLWLLGFRDLPLTAAPTPVQPDVQSLGQPAPAVGVDRRVDSRG